jgi:hypothetical protein
LETRDVNVLIDRLDRIETKLDVVQMHASSIDVTLASQAGDLKYHIRRTDLLEALVKTNTAYRERAYGAWWLIGALALISGIAAVILRVLGR